MKKIEAIIRPTKLDEVKNALEKAGYPSLTVTEVKGRGLQKGITQQWRGREYVVDMLPKIKIEIVAPAEKIDDLMGILRESAATGNIGDGKVFVLPVEKVMRIRTGEMDGEAL